MTRRFNNVPHHDSTKLTNSSSDRALQYQADGVVGGSETITQTGDTNTHAGQGQGNGANVAAITQTGGSGDIAIQNQGLLPGQAGYMFVNSDHVLVHN